MQDAIAKLDALRGQIAAGADLPAGAPGLAKGLIPTLSLHTYKPSQAALDAALGIAPGKDTHARTDSRP
jgi:hypothetical protein